MVKDLSMGEPLKDRYYPIKEHFSSDRNSLAIGTKTIGVALWPTVGWTPAKLIGDADIADFAFSPDGNRFAISFYEQREIRLWNVNDWSTGPVLKVPSQYLYGLAFSPDSRWLALGENTSVRLWD